MSQRPDERSTNGRTARGGSDGGGSDRGIDRREFAKAALAIGGTAALGSLSGCVGTAQEFVDEGLNGGADAAGGGDEKSVARITAAARKNRQHAWDAYEHTAPTGNTVQPANALILMLNYRADGEPNPEHRRQVELAFREIESTFGWGAEGVLFTMAYSATYFDRFEEDPPEGARPMAPQEVVRRAEEVTTDNNITPDEHDAVLLLVSENVGNLLATEAALWGETAEVETESGTKTVSFEDTFEDIFTKPESYPDRRVGFGGPALPTERYNEEVLDDGNDVPEGAPLSMGFVAGFDASIPDEETVTLKEGMQFPTPVVEDSETRDPGVFAQGTLKHLSHVELNLDGWYGTTDLEERRHRMYSPFHTREETGAVGKELTKHGGGRPGADASMVEDDVPDLRARSDGETDGYAERTLETAREGTGLTDGAPTVSHSQKTARARYDVDGDGEVEQPVLRRDWDAIVGDSDSPSYVFNVPMRFNEQIFSLLKSMHDIEFESLDGKIQHEAPESDEWEARNGMVNYTDATHRTNLLIPPITLRSLPYPRAVQLDIEADVGEETVTVRVLNPDGMGSESLDMESVRYGYAETVNQGSGVTPANSRREDGALVLEFPLEGSDIGQDRLHTRLFGKLKGTRRPVTGAVDVPVPTTEDSHY